MSSDDGRVFVIVALMAFGLVPGLRLIGYYHALAYFLLGVVSSVAYVVFEVSGSGC